MHVEELEYCSVFFDLKWQECCRVSHLVSVYSVVSCCFPHSLSPCPQFLKDHRDEATGCHSPPTEVVKEAESDQPQGSRAREELASKRQRVMAQMQSMQRRFLEKNKKQLEEMEGKDEM